MISDDQDTVLLSNELALPPIDGTHEGNCAWQEHYLVPISCISAFKSPTLLSVQPFPVIDGSSRYLETIGFITFYEPSAYPKVHAHGK